MFKKLLVSLVALSAFVSFSQDWDPSIYKQGEQYPGYVIDNKGNKIEGYIKYTNRSSIQSIVYLYKEKDNRKTKTRYKAKDLKEYKMADKMYHCIAYSGGLSKKAIRGNLLVEDGCISYYKWYNGSDIPARRNPGENYEAYMNRIYPPVTVYRNTNTNVIKTNDSFILGFAKRMSAFVKDDAELAAKVKGKEKGYRMLSIMKIMEEYNTNCKK